MADNLPDVDGFSGKYESRPVLPVGRSGETAEITHDGEVWTTNIEGERNVYVCHAKTDVAASGHFILVDRSDTVGFKHDATDRIDLCAVYFQVDKDANTQGQIRVGVITRIDATDADVEYVQALGFNKSSVDQIIRDRNFSPSQLKLKVVDGALQKAVGRKYLNVTGLNTLTPIETPIGTAIPDVGDVIVTYDYVNAEYDFSVATFFHGEDDY